MNRFRTKKKVKETSENLARASTESESKPSKSWGRGKKSQEPEPKPEIDLVNALPSSDDFRTSLLMSGLSARFSMLREQDDPKSKIGKASDDSVLFPKRQSRLNDFVFQSNGLSDIAEVSSINGSIRPPFVSSRTNSAFGDGYGTDEDGGWSIMNRAKPGESNNLFGGRQKISMGNRTLYDNDVSMSAFQKLRQQEREQERQRRDESEAQSSSRPNSPPFSGYNRNRETSSTTSSGGPSLTRSSTAATSVTSQRTPSLNGGHTPSPSGAPGQLNSAPERSNTKNRRLYETGLDNHLHEQQHSAMSRIDTLTRQRGLGGQTPPPQMSPTYSPHPGDRWDRKPVMGQASLPNLRAASPPPKGVAMGTFDFSLRQTSAETKPYGMTSPPLSPPMSEHDEYSVLAVQPNDRGKATALGTFSKPTQAYDENKYSQRQLQMQQGRETPPSRRQSPSRAFPPRQQQQQSSSGRARAESNSTVASSSSRSNSNAQRNFMRQDRIPENSKPQISVPEDRAIAAGTFLTSPEATSPDDLDSPIPEPSRTRANPKPLDLSGIRRPEQQIQERPRESMHPIHRQNVFPEDWNTGNNSSTSSTTTFNLPPKSAPPADSPTLGPTTGLSGMVREHLRSDSNTSSIYGGVPSGDFTSRFPIDQNESIGQNAYATKSNPWETDDWDQSYYGESSFGQDDAANTLNGGSVAPPPLTVRSPISAQDSSRAPWEREMEIGHRREGSSETQKERQDFKEELATRRRRVQENLKSLVENESRSASPLPGMESLRNNALGILKTKTSVGSLVGKPQNGQSKAMKMLGIGAATISSSPSPGKETFGEKAFSPEEDRSGRPLATPPPPPQMRAIRQARREAQRERERQVAIRNKPRTGIQGGEGEWNGYQESNEPRSNNGQRTEQSFHEPRNGMRAPSRERKPPPVALMQRNERISQESKSSSGSSRSGSRPASHMSRDRSGSDDASRSRSRSRNSRLRGDSVQLEGIATSRLKIFEQLQSPPSHQLPKPPGTPSMGFQQSPIPSPMMGQGRSNSRATPALYTDSPKFPPVQPGPDVAEIGISPRPSPPSPFVLNATKPLVSGTPTVPSSSTGQATQANGIAHRKRSINKADISEPRFVSSTSRITTVNLPEGASLHNGGDAGAPPIPAVNPRRRQTRAMFNGLLGRKDEPEELHGLPAATQSTEEMSTFPTDEPEPSAKGRTKLRKSSSEGGNLNARARHAANAAQSPAMPGAFPIGSRSPPRVANNFI